MDLKSKSFQSNKKANLENTDWRFWIFGLKDSILRIMILLVLIILSVNSASAEFLKAPAPQTYTLSQISNKSKMLEYTLTIKITKYAHKYNLERRLLSCLLKIESQYKVGAISPTNDFGIGQINMHNIERKNLDLKRLVSDLDYSIDQAAKHLADVQQLFKPFEHATWACRYNIGNRPITTRGLGAACVNYNAKLSACYKAGDYL
jgi:soluble lytic murein transglycosylase-like protein